MNARALLLAVLIGAACVPEVAAQRPPRGSGDTGGGSPARLPPPAFHLPSAAVPALDAASVHFTAFPALDAAPVHFTAVPALDAASVHFTAVPSVDAASVHFTALHLPAFPIPADPASHPARPAELHRPGPEPWNRRYQVEAGHALHPASDAPLQPQVDAAPDSA